jgi:cysteinyl-tRNA synthetase
MSAIAGLISKTNIYLKENEKSARQEDANISVATVKEIARWITRMVTIFGLEAAASSDGGD